MTKNFRHFSEAEKTLLRGLTGKVVRAFGGIQLLPGSRIAVGGAFLLTENNFALILNSKLETYEINGVIDDFACLHVESAAPDALTAYEDSFFYNLSGEAIEGVKIIRVFLRREKIGNSEKAFQIDLGIQVSTKNGSLVLLNGSIWANEIDLVALRLDEKLPDLDLFDSELGDVWETTVEFIPLD